MERRLQLLLDQTRYDRVAEEAARSGRSVAAVIREAIDYRFDYDDGRAKRAAAALRLLERAQASSDEPPYGTPAELKDDLEREMDEHLDRVLRAGR